ncbi:hypothetical protein GCM10028821_38890 [Hymenobacter jeollabukensis]
MHVRVDDARQHGPLPDIRDGAADGLVFGQHGGNPAAFDAHHTGPNTGRGDNFFTFYCEIWHEGRRTVLQNENISNTKHCLPAVLRPEKLKMSRAASQRADC